MRPTNVVLVDAQPIFRAGVRSVLEETGRYQVVAQAGTGTQASDLCASPDFDLMLLNVQLPVVTGIHVARLLSEQPTTPRIIFLSNERDADTMTAATRAGAAAFLPRDTPSDELVRILDRVVAGEDVLAETIATTTADDHLIPDGAATADLADDDGLHLLSVLEVQVLAGMAEGLSIREIATTLATPEATVEQYHVSALRKLRVDDQTKAVHHARRHGWIPELITEPVSASAD